jgi:hypothetical protein
VSLSIGILAATTAVACLSSSSGGPAATADGGGTGSSGSTSGGSTSSGSGSGSSSGGVAEASPGTLNVALTPTNTGYVSVSSINLVGAWFSYGDELGSNGAPPGDCQNAGFTGSQCSSIAFPPGPSTGPEAGPATFPPFPVDGGPGTLGTMCLSGVAAQVPDLGATPDYSAVFGIGIGLDFNNPHGTVMPYNASAITALTFTVSGLPTDTGTRVNIEFQEPATDVAPNDAWAYQITANGPTTVYLASGAGPGQLSPAFAATYPAGQSQPPFDPTMIEGIQFHVVTNITNPIDVSALCISDLTAVVTE